MRDAPGPSDSVSRMTRTALTVLPYGGDLVVARSIAKCHQRNPWTGRCRACKDPYPCRDRGDANTVLEHGTTHPSGGTGDISRVTAAKLLGLHRIAASIAGLVR